MQRLLGYPNQTCILYHDYHVQSHTCHEVKKTVFREVVLQSRFCWSGGQHRGSSPSLFSARCHHWSAAVLRRPHSGRFLSLSTCEHETSGGRWTHGNHGRNRGRWTQYTMAIRSDLPTKCVDRFCLASTIPSENPKDTIVFSLPLAPQHDFAAFFQDIAQRSWLSPALCRLSSYHWSFCQKPKLEDGFFGRWGVAGNPPVLVPTTYPAEANGVLCPLLPKHHQRDSTSPGWHHRKFGRLAEVSNL